MSDKIYFNYQEIDRYCRDIAKNAKTDFNPDLILAIGGGGLIPARIMRTILNIPIYVVTLNYYDDNDKIMSEPKVIQWIDNSILKNKKVLIVDEINDTGKTLEYVISNIDSYSKLGVAVIHDKVKCKKKLNVDYSVQGGMVKDKWVVYPWD